MDGDIQDFPKTFIPSSPINARGDRVLVRGVPEGIERLVQQTRATARVQARERILAHIEKIPGLLEVLTEDQLEGLLEALLALCDGTAREYAQALISALPKAIGRIPTYASVPDPRDQPMVEILPGAAPPDPLVSGDRQRD